MVGLRNYIIGHTCLYGDVSAFMKHMTKLHAEPTRIHSCCYYYIPYHHAEEGCRFLNTLIGVEKECDIDSVSYIA